MSRLDRTAWATTTYPDRPGSVFGSRTSKAAADSLVPKLGKLRATVLELFRQTNTVDGWTDDEVQRALGGPTVWRPRRVELTALGYLDDSGATRATPSGRQATVWICTDKGRAA